MPVPAMASKKLNEGKITAAEYEQLVQSHERFEMKSEVEEEKQQRDRSGADRNATKALERAAQRGRERRRNAR